MRAPEGDCALMRRFFLAALALLLAASPATPHTPWSGTLPGLSGGVITYTGPCEIVGFNLWVGVRSCSSSYAAASGAAFDLRRSTDNATMTVNYLPTGFVDTASVSTWLAASPGSSALVSKAYDSSGNTRDMAQGSGASQPTLKLSGGPGNKPYLETTANNQRLSGTSFASATGVISVVTLGFRSGGGSSQVFCFQNAGNGIRTANIFDINPAANKWVLVGNSKFTATASDNAWHDAQAAINPPGTTTFTIDGSDNTGSVTAWTTAGLPQMLNGANGVTQGGTECGIKDGTAFDGTQRSAIHNNQRTAYCGSTGCSF
jgi:hypothetical protein